MAGSEIDKKRGPEGVAYEAGFLFHQPLSSTKNAIESEGPSGDP